MNGFIAVCSEHCRLPVRVLIRPRFGDFCYTEAEFQMMEHQVAHFKKLGADAVVIGCLKDRTEDWIWSE